MGVKKALALFVVLCVFLNVLLTVFGRGGFGCFIIVASLCLYIGLPLLVASAIFYTVAKFKSSGKLKVVSNFCFYSALLLGSSVLSFFSGGVLLDYDISKAKRYCESLVPALDEYKDVNGNYPKSLTRVSDQKKVPRLLRRNSYYSSDGDSFEYFFMDPGGMMNGFGFSSNDRQWYEWH